MPTPDEIMANPQAYRFIPGKGYVHLGAPSMPANPVAGAEACEPPAVAANGSMHTLQPPMGADPMNLTWRPDVKTWMPLLGTGRRTGFTSAYLAAHGWSYVGPA